MLTKQRQFDKKPAILVYQGLRAFYLYSINGECEYCYLLNNLGKKPYVRIYVNTEEILSAARDYIEKRKPEITVFEGAATSDPIPMEPYTGILRRVIEFFGKTKRIRL